jgi:hypothetical protein
MLNNISNENCQFWQAKEIMEDNLEQKDQKIKYDDGNFTFIPTTKTRSIVF